MVMIWSAVQDKFKRDKELQIMENNQKEYEKDYSLLRPFDLEKAKAGELLCENSDQVTYKFIGYSESDKFICKDYLAVQTINNTHDSIYLCKDKYLRMKHLCWIEGKPVYKGDKLWSKSIRNWYYIVDHINSNGSIVATDDSTGYLENPKELSWINPLEVKKQEQNEEILKHDPTKFKVGDKVKVVRKFKDGFGIGESNTNWNNDWVSEMDTFFGNIHEVLLCGSEGFWMENDNELGYWFPSFALELVEAAEEKPKTKKVKLYAYLIGGDSFNLGWCSENNLHDKYTLYKRVPSEDKEVEVEI